MMVGSNFSLVFTTRKPSANRLVSVHSPLIFFLLRGGLCLIAQIQIVLNCCEQASQQSLPLEPQVLSVSLLDYLALIFLWQSGASTAVIEDREHSDDKRDSCALAAGNVELRPPR